MSCCIILGKVRRMESVRKDNDFLRQSVQLSVNIFSLRSRMLNILRGVSQRQDGFCCLLLHLPKGILRGMEGIGEREYICGVIIRERECLVCVN